MDITSPQNPRVKHIVKLRDDKKTRMENGLMLVEGYDEIQLALAAGHQPQTLLCAPELASQPLTVDASESRRVEPVETLTVSRAVFEKISYRENPDGWLAIFPIPNTTFDDLKLSDTPLVIVAESIEKPGNLGAILRTADAAGVDALIVCGARADAWNPNVVRASRGAVFSVPIVTADHARALAWLKRGEPALSRVEAMRIVAASPSAEAIYSDVDLRQPVAIVVGTEDAGLSDFWLQNADMKVKIPMIGKVNSLNVSVSTALIVYEARRQRGR